MSDTAEYWFDKNDIHKKEKKVFIHKKGLDCGHFHVIESKKIKNVDCYACIKILKGMHNDYDELMKPIESSNIICECGSIMVKRQNKSTKEYFMGCTKYPNCKQTKSIKNVV